MTTHSTRYATSAVSILIASIALAMFPASASAVTKIEGLCTIGGQTELTLRGQGLVVGLNGTGDADNNAVTVRAVMAYLHHNGQQGTPGELKKLNNYAVVELTATIPRAGIALGQKLDCDVSALGGVKSLSGGRLVLAGLALPNDRDPTGGDLLVSATAEGLIHAEDPRTPTSGRIPGGVNMARTINSNASRNSSVMELLIRRPYASYRLAYSIEKAINERFSFEGEIAKAQSQFSVIVEVPGPYRDSPIQFVSDLMAVSVNEAGSYPRVVINSKEGIVTTTSSVSISAAAFTHRNINVEIGNPFSPIASDAAGSSSQQLSDLLDALNQLKVPPDDIIAIVRELHTVGSLHAELIEH